MHTSVCHNAISRTCTAKARSALILSLVRAHNASHARARSHTHVSRLCIHVYTRVARAFRGGVVDLPGSLVITLGAIGPVGLVSRITCGVPTISMCRTALQPPHGENGLRTRAGAAATPVIGTFRSVWPRDLLGGSVVFWLLRDIFVRWSGKNVFPRGSLEFRSPVQWKMNCRMGNAYTGYEEFYPEGRRISLWNLRYRVEH